MHLAGLCERIVDIEEDDGVLDRALVERRVNSKSSGHCICVESKLCLFCRCRSREPIQVAGTVDNLEGSL